MMPPDLFFFLKIVLAVVLESFMVSSKFWIVNSISLKDAFGILKGIALNLYSSLVVWTF